MSPTMSQLDGLRIPARLLEQAKGIAVLTAVKGGFGLAGFEVGTGLVVARLSGGVWSAPSAIGTAGVSWGALVGAQLSDHVFVCMTEEAVEMLMSSNGSVQLGADIGVAVGPVGRAVEADYGASPHHVAPIYTYSLSKGLYAGISVAGKVIVTRHNVNEKFYGRRVTPEEILQGRIPTPPAAQPLYDALTRCHVYTQPNYHATRRAPANAAAVYTPNTEAMEYGEFEPNYSNMNFVINNNMGSSSMSASGSQIYNMQQSYNNTQPNISYAGQQHQQQPQMQQPPMAPPPPIPQAAPQLPQPTIAQLPPLPVDQHQMQHGQSQSQQQQQEHPLPMPPAANDAHSYAGTGDITSDLGN